LAEARDPAPLWSLLGHMAGLCTRILYCVLERLETTHSHTEATIRHVLSCRQVYKQAETATQGFVSYGAMAARRTTSSDQSLTHDWWSTESNGAEETFRNSGVQQKISATDGDKSSIRNRMLDPRLMLTLTTWCH